MLEHLERDDDVVACGLGRDRLRRGVDLQHGLALRARDVGAVVGGHARVVEEPLARQVAAPDVEDAYGRRPRLVDHAGRPLFDEGVEGPVMKVQRRPKRGAPRPPSVRLAQLAGHAVRELYRRGSALSTFANTVISPREASL